MRSITLDKIKTWEEYYLKNKSSIPTSKTKLFPSDQEINRKVSIWEGDITHLRIDAIVNAAKSSLLGGGGVDGAIHKAAGAELKKACKLLGGTSPGTAKITRGFELPASYVIHAVGPQDKDPRVLQSAYESSLNLTQTNGIRSIAFPCISTGIFGFPNEEAAEIAANSVRKFLNRKKRDMDRIIFVVFDEIDKKIYEKVLPKYFPVESSDDTTGPTRRKERLETPMSSAKRITSTRPKSAPTVTRTRSRSPITSTTPKYAPTVTRTRSRSPITSTMPKYAPTVTRTRSRSPIASTIPISSTSSMSKSSGTAERLHLKIRIHYK